MIVYVIVGPIAYHVSLHLWKDIEYSDHSFIINIDICIVLQECSTEKDNSLKENENKGVLMNSQDNVQHLPVHCCKRERVRHVTNSRRGHRFALGHKK